MSAAVPLARVGPLVFMGATSDGERFVWACRRCCVLVLSPATWQAQRALGKTRCERGHD